MKRMFGVLTMLMVLSLGAGAASVDPILYEKNMWQSGNPKSECNLVDCGDSDFHYKFDDWDNSYYNGQYDVDGPTTITISNNSFTSFDWSTIVNGVPTGLVYCVIVKAGNAANVFCYPEGATEDTNLYGPVNASGEPANVSHATFCYNDPGMCYEEETAWAEGARYVKKGNWAMYVEYEGVEKTVNLIADYSNWVVAGDVTFSAPVDGFVTITVNLTGGAIFYYDLNDPLYDDNLKVQDYDKAPTKTPSPGLFEWKTRIEPGSTTGSITVPVNNFYGVHIDLALLVPCE